MADDRVGTTSVGKSIRSLVEAMRSLENEGELLLQKLTERPTDRVRAFARLAASLSRSAASTDFFSFLRAESSTAPQPRMMRRWAEVLGLTDDAAVEGLRSQIAELFEQVGRLREREVALAGGVSQLRARAASFEDALAGLARVQGRFSARLGLQHERSDNVERLAQRRDDHITRLIRDTAAQRAEIERLVGEIQEARKKQAEQPDPPDRAVADERLVAVQRQFEDFRKTQKTAGQGVIDALEGLRERLARIESRSVEMSREARAKTGRIDALARHMSLVEGRLSSAMGTRGGASGTSAAAQEESSAALSGQT
jgi:chromosome segregation ATPase